MQVSLITCTNNSEKTIKDCCLSIFSQTFNNIEHVIVDNHSFDNTLYVAKNSKIKLQRIISQKSRGIYGALNEGIKHARGDIIGTLHSDDQLIDKNVINKITKIFQKEKIDILFANLLYVSKIDNKKIIRKWKSNLNQGIQSNDKLNKKIDNGWMFPHTTLFIKKNLLNEIGKYNENFKISSDYEFIIRLIRKKNFKIFFLNDYIVKMRIGGMSNKNLKNILIKMIEDYKIMEKFQINPLKGIIIKNLSKLKQLF
tara:strand:- start:6595 stop:7359 length:765 start_codon:yes stop_codon:yes gene_type:complete